VGGTYNVSAIADVDCADGGVWNRVRRICLAGVASEGAPPIITMKSDRSIVRYGDTTGVNVTINSEYDVSCEISGLGRSTETFEHKAGESVHIFVTEPLTSTKKVTTTCLPKTLDPVSTSLSIEVIPRQQEV
jgi:hypothetical protein